MPPRRAHESFPERIRLRRKRQGTAALQNLRMREGAAHSTGFLECASPLALWQGSSITRPSSTFWGGNGSFPREHYQARRWDKLSPPKWGGRWGIRQLL